MNTQSRWAAALLFLLPSDYFPSDPAGRPIRPPDNAPRRHREAVGTLTARRIHGHSRGTRPHEPRGVRPLPHGAGLLGGDTRRKALLGAVREPRRPDVHRVPSAGRGAAPQPGLRAGSPEQACAGCHDLTRQGDAEGSSACTQGSVLLGAGLPGRTPDERAGGHSRVPRGCVGCHMARPPADVDDPPVGGHTFRVASNGAGPRILNAYACRCCHA